METDENIKRDTAAYTVLVILIVLYVFGFATFFIVSVNYRESVNKILADKN